MNEAEFSALAAQGYNRIPVSTEVLADLETPVSTYRKLGEGAFSYFFESVQGGEKWGRYSIIGLPCRTLLRVFGNRVEVLVDGAVVEQAEVDDPLQYVEDFQQRYRSAPDAGLPVFHGGLVGYFGYDTVRYVEPRLRAGAPRDELGNPDILLMVSEEVLVFDNLSGTIRLIINADPQRPGALQEARQRLSALALKLREPMPPLPDVALAGADSDTLEASATSHFDEPGFARVVERIKDYVLAGDVMQVVPSQRLEVPFGAPPLNLYRALRNLNPSPYMYYLDLGDFHIVGSSPEILARLQNNEVTVRPLAGTRRRGYSEAEDRALEAELLADPKEIAEHLMLIDLGRNDIGRIARIGSVTLSDKMAVERYSHVMHIVSNVCGQLQPGKSAIDVLRATLPAGTLSGAPKIRAMEIIDELEPVKRGVYGGAVGYLSWAGEMDTAIAIRTAVIKDGKLYIQVGAGVVADSVPRLEWKETHNKARAMFRAASMVLAGLDSP
ncbi:MAG: anthranilate synthase component I [Haliea sp.]|uniref:anthranilate synthase component I n=1 Tax=Haliea sp. TaxID=1932666 RepID=UPI000C4732B0|nr:anthranilate synthase component I [Haliea sp.]MBM69389.1 anthranilate synthase component I [Haliea sp.]|tara:strand:+ start:13309 stop:14799 length:1491 start_codon:yes stop_codon:yes gene_type:complete